MKITIETNEGTMILETKNYEYRANVEWGAPATKEEIVDILIDDITHLVNNHYFPNH